MKKSPGHQKWPEHTVEEEHLDEPMRVEANGEVIAESSDVIRLEEDEHPVRYYFPRSDVDMDRFDSSDRETECPFKGTGRYFDLRAGDRSLGDAAWSFEETYEEHGDLKDRIAFHDEELDEIAVRVAA